MNYRNPRKHPNGFIDCEIEHPVYGWIPFTCSPNDYSKYFDIFSLYNKMNSDPELKFIKIIEPTKDEKRIMLEKQVRIKRNMLLEQYVDPIICNPLRWNDMNELEQNKYIEYRRKLLDISLQDGFPYDIIWPKLA